MRPPATTPHTLPMPHTLATRPPFATQPQHFRTPSALPRRLTRRPAHRQPPRRATAVATDGVDSVSRRAVAHGGRSRRRRSDARRGAAGAALTLTLSLTLTPTPTPAPAPAPTLSAHLQCSRGSRGRTPSTRFRTRCAPPRSRSPPHILSRACASRCVSHTGLEPQAGRAHGPRQLCDSRTCEPCYDIYIYIYVRRLAALNDTHMHMHMHIPRLLGQVTGCSACATSSTRSRSSPQSSRCTESTAYLPASCLPTCLPA